MTEPPVVKVSAVEVDGQLVVTATDDDGHLVGVAIHPVGP